MSDSVVEIATPILDRRVLSLPKQPTTAPTDIPGVTKVRAAVYIVVTNEDMKREPSILTGITHFEEKILQPQEDYFEIVKLPPGTAGAGIRQLLVGVSDRSGAMYYSNALPVEWE